MEGMRPIFLYEISVLVAIIIHIAADVIAPFPNYYSFALLGKLAGNNTSGKTASNDQNVAVR